MDFSQAVLYFQFLSFQFSRRADGNGCVWTRAGTCPRQWEVPEGCDGARGGVLALWQPPDTPAGRHDENGSVETEGHKSLPFLIPTHHLSLLRQNLMHLIKPPTKPPSPSPETRMQPSAGACV